MRCRNCFRACERCSVPTIAVAPALILLSSQCGRLGRRFVFGTTRERLVNEGDSYLPGGLGYLDDDTGTQARFAEWTASLASVLGHADRVRPFADYCIGLLSTEGRKSVEPLAAVTAPERTAAQHQSLLHFVAQAPWSDQAMLRRVREASAVHHP